MRTKRATPIPMPIGVPRVTNHTPVPMSTNGKSTNNPKATQMVNVKIAERANSVPNNPASHPSTLPDAISGKPTT